MKKKWYVNNSDAILVFGPHTVELKKEVCLSDEEIHELGITKLIETEQLVLRDPKQEPKAVVQKVRGPVAEVTTAKLSETADAFDTNKVSAGGATDITVPKSVGELLDKENENSNIEDLEDDNKSEIPVEGAEGTTETLDEMDVSNKPVNLGSWVKEDKKSPVIGGSEITGQDMIQDAKNATEAAMQDLGTAAAKQDKEETMPDKVKKFFSKKFLAQKWGILKSNDEKFLKALKEYAGDRPNIIKLVNQRLEELKKK